MTPEFLALDAGGTSTRAVALDASGRVSGYGRAGSGNPTAVGIADAVAAIGRAAELAAAYEVGRGAETAGGIELGREGPSLAVIAMAGEQTGVFAEQVTARLAPLGVRRVLLLPDLLGMFHSGTHQRDGYGLIAGTGSVAARIRDGRLEQVVGGKGWLLGDAGSGFWIGHHVARAVMAALDGQGPATALTGSVLQALGIEAQGTTAKGIDAQGIEAQGIEADPGSAAGRAYALSRLVAAIYARPPVQLAEFAPLAFAAYVDPVARDILVAASAALANLVSVVRVPTLSGPIVGGGSVLVQGMLAAPPELRRQLVPPAGEAEVIPVRDGVVGAAVLALRSAGVEVDATLFARVRAEVDRFAG